jgi:hypothetical protein
VGLSKTFVPPSRVAAPQTAAAQTTAETNVILTMFRPVLVRGPRRNAILSRGEAGSSKSQPTCANPFFGEPFGDPRIVSGITITDFLTLKRNNTIDSIMNRVSRYIFVGLARRTARSILVGALLVSGVSTTVLAQGEIANGTVSSSGGGPYTYDLTFGAAANSLSPVGSIWYAWVPGFFYLPGAPIAGSAHAPAGWTATIVGNSLQFAASSQASYIPIGSSLTGFSYQANFTPAQLAAAANSGRSVAYAGGIQSDSGYTFTVLPATVPEPSTVTLLMAGTAALLLVVRRRFWLA